MALWYSVLCTNVVIAAFDNFCGTLLAISACKTHMKSWRVLCDVCWYYCVHSKPEMIRVVWSRRRRRRLSEVLFNALVWILH